MIGNKTASGIINSERASIKAKLIHNRLEMTDDNE